MALVESTSVPLGSELPPLTLPNVDRDLVTITNMLGDKGMLVFVTCNHCPYALAVWPRIIKLAQEFKPLGITTIALNPNAANPHYPEDDVEHMKEFINTHALEFPYLADESQDAAKKLDAQCTPDIYLYNADKKLVYHGRVDDNWKDEHKVTNHELKAAMNALVNGLEITKDQKPSMGCSIKWN